MAPFGAPPPVSPAPLYVKSTLGSEYFDVEDLEALAADRLTVLKAGDDARAAAAAAGGGEATGGAAAAATSAAVAEAMRVAERETNLALPASATPAAARAWRLTDEAGHFVLRLALCKSPESRAWLLGREVELFRMRLSSADVAVSLATLAESGGAPAIRPIPKAEVEALRAPLDAVARGPRYGRAGDTTTTRYYGVPFEAVTSLVRSRRLFLRGGEAYLPERHLIDVVVTHFRLTLSAGLTAAARAVGRADADARMRPVLDMLRARQLAASSTGRPTFVEADGVDRISLHQLGDATAAMPLCMQHMLSSLREAHHLRHGARMQLGLFLKACGLTMDESLTLWKAEFGRGSITSDKFDRQYAYNIRHYYGKEGQRKALNAYSCTKVMAERPGAGEHHGCPYRELAPARLRTRLLEAGAAAGATVDGIVATAAAGHYQHACGACFEATQPKAAPSPSPVGANGEVTVAPPAATATAAGAGPSFVPTHPNEYFVEARRRRCAPPPPPVPPSQEAESAMDVNGSDAAAEVTADDGAANGTANSTANGDTSGTPPAGAGVTEAAAAAAADANASDSADAEAADAAGAANAAAAAAGVGGGAAAADAAAAAAAPDAPAVGVAPAASTAEAADGGATDAAAAASPDVAAAATDDEVTPATADAAAVAGDEDEAMDVDAGASAGAVE